MELIKSFSEFLEENGVEYRNGLKKYLRTGIAKRIFFISGQEDAILLVKGLKGKIFNYDKSIWISERERNVLENNPNMKVVFNLAGFWFLSSTNAIKAGKDNGFQCVVDYKDPMSFVKKAEKAERFVHLHNHFEHSQLDGCFSPEKWVQRCQEIGFNALALTDHGTLAGIMDFYLKAKKVGGIVKPILGSELYVMPEYQNERKLLTHLTVLARNELGWRHLMKLNTIAQRNFYYRPRVDFANLKKYGKGLLFLSGCPYSAMNRFLLNNEIELAIELYEFYCSCVGEEHFYLEVQFHDFVDENALQEQFVMHKNLRKLVLQLKKRGKKPKVVLTNDCHYILPSDSEVFFALGRINIRGEEQREEKRQSDIWLKTRVELFNTFKRSKAFKEEVFTVLDFKNWCENTLLIAEKCNVELTVGQHRLPKFPLPTNEKSAESLFDRIIKEGTLRKLGSNPTSKYLQRLEYEAGVIKKAGFVDYFLIIWDIIQQAKKNDIYVGAARGSVAGSLVAYVIDITDVDPLKFSLLFERFLNETRVSGERAKNADALPDIDVDFESAGRDWVKKYIETKYGAKNVGSLATYGRLQLRAAIKDIGRSVAGAGFEYLNKITGKIFGQEWKDLAEAFARHSEVAEFIDQYPDVMRVVGRCLGQVRHPSIHPAGVIISPATRIAKDGTEKKAQLDDFIPVKLQKTGNGEEKILVTEWELLEVERAGMLKLDILGIKQLDIFKEIVRLVKERRKIDISFHDIPLNDEKVFERFREGDTEGVFQFKSRTQKEYQKFLQPTNFEHLIAANALLRPGAMIMNAHIDYVHIKNGEKEPEYDPGAEQVTRSTFGLYVYQEQIMQAAHVVGGLSLADADVMRTAIKKFDKEKMMRFREDFIKGAMKLHGYDKEGAEYVWKKLEAFSGYGFNRSHSCSYAMLGYWCNWLKLYYTPEFWCANLEYADEDDRNAHVSRIMQTYSKIGLLYPDVNDSYVRFSLNEDGEIVWGLSHVKGVGQKASVAILAARGDKPFESLKDFLGRVQKSIVNKRVVLALIYSGAFDKVEKAGEDVKKRIAVLNEFYTIRKEKVEVEEDERSLQDAFKSLLGISFYDWEQIVDNNKYHDYVSLTEFASVSYESLITVAGVVVKIREHLPRSKSKDEDKMAFITLKQNEEEVDLLIWADKWFELKEKVKLDMKMVFRGIKKFDLFRNKLIVMSCKQTILKRLK
jgi:DNA polymerase III subunit alpha